jgi:hypothetical protein
MKVERAQCSTDHEARELGVRDRSKLVNHRIGEIGVLSTYVWQGNDLYVWPVEWQKDFSSGKHCEAAATRSGTRILLLHLQSAGFQQVRCNDRFIAKNGCWDTVIRELFIGITHNIHCW